MDRKNLKIFLAIFAVAFLLRLPSLWTPIIDVDESQFAGFALSLLSGGLPYIDSVDTKPLGIYWFFAIIFLLFGKNNMLAVHLVTTFWVSLTGWTCFRIGNLLYSRRAGFLSGLFFIIFSTCYFPKIISTSIVLVMMLPLTLSVWHLVRSENKNLCKPYDIWLSGLFFGIACLFKYQAGATWFAVALYTLFFRPLYLTRSFRPTQFKSFAIYTAAASAVALLYFLYLEKIGVLEAFRFFSIQGSVSYLHAGQTSFQFLERFFIRGGSFILATFPLWYFGIRESLTLTRHLFATRKHSTHQSERYLIFFWFLSAILAVSAGGRFFGHYFLQLIPALGILAGGSADRFLEKLAKNPKMAPKRRWLFRLFVAGFLFFPIAAFGLRLAAPLLYKKIGEDHADLYRPIANTIRERTKPGDKIFVWGFATPIYFFSERQSASRFLWCDWLTGRVAGSSSKQPFFDTSPFITKGSWEMLFADLQKNRPIYIVDTSPGNYHDYGRFPIDNFPQLEEYLGRFYLLETELFGAHFYRRKSE